MNKARYYTQFCVTESGGCSDILREWTTADCKILNLSTNCKEMSTQEQSPEIATKLNRLVPTKRIQQQMPTISLQTVRKF
jgi:hypothetical protein